MTWLRGLLLAVAITLLTGCMGAGSSGKVLVWIGEGMSPDRRTGNTTGEVVYYNPDGSVESLLEVPANATGVLPCGDEATSPDRRYFTFLVNVAEGGRDGGTLYQIIDSGKPEAISEAHALSCTGNGTFQYSPDSKRLAYIDYDELTNNSEFAAGTLRIFNSDSREEIATFEDVGAFELGNENAQLLQFYADRNNRLDEIAIVLWENNTTTEIATLFADAGCRYTSARIVPAGGRLVILAGHRCANSGTNWQLYTVNRDGNDLTLALTDAQRGGFFPNTRTNNLMVSQNDQTLLFTPPDGITRFTTGLLAVPVGDLQADEIATVITSGAIMPVYTARSFTLPETAYPIFSPDNRWWAVVSNISSGQAIQLIDHNNFTLAEGVAASVTGNNRISSMMFSPDSKTLYFVGGGRDGEENTLNKLDVATGTSTEIVTGNFGAGVIAPDGSALALVVWKRGTDSNQTRHQTLALVNTGDGNVIRTQFTGIEYNASNELRTRRFVYPLAYR